MNESTRTNTERLGNKQWRHIPFPTADQTRFQFSSKKVKRYDIPNKTARNIRCTHSNIVMNTLYTRRPFNLAPVSACIVLVQA